MNGKYPKEVITAAEDLINLHVEQYPENERAHLNGNQMVKAAMVTCKWATDHGKKKALWWGHFDDIEEILKYLEELL